MAPKISEVALVALAAVASACDRSIPSASEGAFDTRRADVVAALADFRKIVSPRGIEVLETVQIGGIPQWLSIRGTDRANPILLYLHGGPGYPAMPLGYTQRGWEDYFTVVQWDQRGAGKTYASNDPAKIAPTITMERMLRDAEEVVTHLRSRFGKQKIFVVGHSWGTILGTQLAQRHPEWLHAYVGTGQVVGFGDNERVGYQFAVERARADHRAEAIDELAKLAPYPDAAGRVTLDKLLIQRKWVQHYGGAVHRRSGFGHEVEVMALSPDYGPKDLAAGEQSGEVSVTRLLGELEQLDFHGITKLACPTFLFLGRHDHMTPSSVAAAWFERLEAPAKQLVWFEHSAHMMHNEEPGKMLVELVRWLRPIAERAGDVAPDREP